MNAESVWSGEEGSSLGQDVFEGPDRLGRECGVQIGVAEAGEQPFVGALELAVENVDSVPARVGEPDCAERVLHDGAQEWKRGVALARGVQGADCADQVRDVKHRSPADHGRPVHPVDPFPKVRSDQSLEPVQPGPGIRFRHAVMVADADCGPRAMITPSVEPSRPQPSRK